ncbi:hypothetical protein M9H77_08747 [Catharanthus roseus]|uniref:Uncharacterized protein n=1 Tax=Catharanthus roseus TaxID=4058 RepID=A0ACC0BYK0_CATRO|nr:hypothetical protein M9H77_08747 [Catharanthus roseus]
MRQITRDAIEKLITSLSQNDYGTKARNCYLLMGYPKGSLKQWTEENKDFGTGGRKGRERTNIEKGCGGGRSGSGRKVLGSSPASSGWAAAATVQQIDLSSLEYGARCSAVEQNGAVEQNRVTTTITTAVCLLFRLTGPGWTSSKNGPAQDELTGQPNSSPNDGRPVKFSQPEAAHVEEVFDHASEVLHHANSGHAHHANEVLDHTNSSHAHSNSSSSNSNPSSANSSDSEPLVANSVEPLNPRQSNS